MRIILVGFTCALFGACVEAHPDWVGLEQTSGETETTSTTTGSASTDTASSTTSTTGSGTAVGTTALSATVGSTSSTSGTSGESTTSSTSGGSTTSSDSSTSSTSGGSTTALTATGGSSGGQVCGVGECADLAAVLFTEDFSSNFEPLDTSGPAAAEIWVFVPGDVLSLPVVLTSASQDDPIDVQLWDGLDVLASCTAAGTVACDLGAVNTSAHNNRVLLLEAVDTLDGSFERGLTIEVSATTSGLYEPLQVSSFFKAAQDAAAWVLWPVGPGTGSYSYTWSTMNQERYSAGVLWDNGLQQFSESNVNAVMTNKWPSSGSPQGFYLFGVSTFYDKNIGVGWTFGVTP